MKTSLFVKASLLCVTLALAGCASKVTSPEKYSGFLKDYSGLQETTSASGKTVMRWVAPGFDFNQYDSLVYNPVVYYPIPKPNTQITPTSNLKPPPPHVNLSLLRQGRAA